MKRSAVLLASMTLAVLLTCGVAFAQTSVVDQENTATTGAGVFSFNSSNSSQAVAQTFTVGKTGELDAVEVFVGNQAVNDALRIAVYELDSNGVPNERMRAVSWLGVDEVPRVPVPSGSWVRANFPNKPYLVSGQKYAIVLDSTETQGLYYWVNSDDTYSGGQTLYKYYPETGDSWGAVSGCDFLFRTFMTPDTVAPTGSVAINGDRLRTASRMATLRLNATDPSPSSGVASMRFKNAGGNWTTWLPYAESKDWKLTRGAGKKTVYAQYMDAAGNTSAKTSDSITYRP